MGSTTAKGYPYPVGTDRVMDGDNAIQALAEAVDEDSGFTRCLASGQSVAAQTVGLSVAWAAPNPNGAALTHGPSTTLTVTKAGLYVITATILVGNFQTAGTRNYVLLACGPPSPHTQNRTIFGGENNGTATLVAALVPGDTIRVDIYTNAATSIAAANGTSYLNVARLGRT